MSNQTADSTVTFDAHSTIPIGNTNKLPAELQFEEHVKGLLINAIGAFPSITEMIPPSCHNDITGHVVASTSTADVWPLQTAPDSLTPDTTLLIDPIVDKLPPYEGGLPSIVYTDQQETGELPLKITLRVRGGYSPTPAEHIPTSHDSVDNRHRQTSSGTMTEMSLYDQVVPRSNRESLQAITSEVKVSRGRAAKRSAKRSRSGKKDSDRSRSSRERTPSPPSHASEPMDDVSAGARQSPSSRRGSLVSNRKDTSGFRHASSDDPYYHDKLVISSTTVRELIDLVANGYYYPFHPDGDYTDPCPFKLRSSPFQDLIMKVEYKKPDLREKAVLHWYIALHQPSKINCPLEASPEAWDSRGQRVIPIADIIDEKSGFNSKEQRDMLAKLYLLMYYRHIWETDGPMSVERALQRIGVPYCRQELQPLILNCTFCNQYSDIQWTHIELFDRGELKKNRFREAGLNGPVRIGILSLLTCNHRDCENRSANNYVPKRRSYGERKDSEDYYCQLFAHRLANEKHRIEMKGILIQPTQYFPPHLGGDEEKRKWANLDLDENTVRYIRMEEYMTAMVKQYFDYCRVCGDYLHDDPGIRMRGSETMTRFAQKGNICSGKGWCNWVAAVEQTTEAMISEFGDEWAEMVKAHSAMRRGVRGKVPRKRMQYTDKGNDSDEACSFRLSEDNEDGVEESSVSELSDGSYRMRGGGEKMGIDESEDLDGCEEYMKDDEVFEDIMDQGV